MSITITKTIEILELNVKEAAKGMPPDVKDALNLSIEALKRLLQYRQFHPSTADSPLPGEAP